MSAGLSQNATSSRHIDHTTGAVHDNHGLVYVTRTYIDIMPSSKWVNYQFRDKFWVDIVHSLDC